MTTFVHNYPPMWHTIRKPKLSFFKNRYEHGMLTSSVSSYAPLLVKSSILPRSPEIFSRSFPERTQILLIPCIQPKISQHSIPYVTHEENNVGLQIIHTIKTFFIVLMNQKQKQPCKAVIYDGLSSQWPSIPLISAHLGWWDHMMKNK